MQQLSTWFRSRRPLAVRLLPALLAIALPVPALADGPADAAASMISSFIAELLAQLLGVKAQMVFDEGGDEIVAVVIAIMAA